jgi:RNA polymerase sigma factor (sigma-70 family)
MLSGGLMKDNAELVQLAAAAVAGDRFAAEELLCALQDDIYRLSLRMLGHPQDAEDAAQEILLVILTHLGSFRAESSFRTWYWRVASNHLVRARRGRLERVTFESITELLDRQPEGNEPEPPQAEMQLFALEVRLRCTEAMLLALDRNLRIAFVLGEIFGLSGEEAAAVLELDPATYRKRLSRARVRLLGFLRAQCGVFDPRNPCRCEKQVGPALARGQLVHTELLLSSHPQRPGGRAIERYAREVDQLLRAAEVLRHPDYAAPPGLLAHVRSIVHSERFELLGHSGLGR